MINSINKNFIYITLIHFSNKKIPEENSSGIFISISTTQNKNLKGIIFSRGMEISGKI